MARTVIPSAARPPALLVLGTLAAAVPAAWGQERINISPSFSATQLFTDNRNLSATDRQSESITVLSPGIRVTSRSGRVQGSLSYTLRGTFYARDSTADGIQNALSASGSAEVIDNHGFVDASASITRQSISAFDLQGDRPNDINRNSTEVRRFTVSPSLRGRLFGEVDVEARWSSSLSSSADDDASDSVGHQASLRLDAGGPRFGWSAQAHRSISDYDGGRRTTQDRFAGNVYFKPDYNLRLFLTAGIERNDVQSVDQRSYATWGGGASWQPTPRTNVALQGERRFFGHSHSLSLSHRMRRSVVSYSDTRSVTETTAGVAFTLSAYELYFAQFASIEPDPVLRDVLVRDFLEGAGLDPDERISGGFLNTALSVQRGRNLSLAMRGARSTVVVSAFGTRSRRADTISGAQDDLSRVDVLRQYGYSLSWSHRLTPTSAMVLSAAERRTPGRGSVAGNGLRTVSASWSTRFARRAGLSLTGRHSQADGVNAYKESTISAALNVSF